MISEIIKRAMNEGVQLFVENGQLRFQVKKNCVFAPELKSLVVANKAEIISFIQDHARDATIALETIPKAPADEPKRLSFQQQRLWFIDELEGGSPEYYLPTAIRISGPFDAHIAEQAMNRLVTRHEPLRTVFYNEGGIPYQKVQSEFHFKLIKHDLSACSPDEKKATLASIIHQDTNEGYDLSKDLMIRAHWIALSYTSGKEEGVLQINMHHIASDGWSKGVLINEFVTQYQAISNEQADPLPPLKVQYADYAAWQRKELGSRDDNTQLGYWLKQLQDVPKLHSLPLDHERVNPPPRKGDTHHSKISRELSVQLDSIAKKQGVTMYMLLHAALGIVLSRHSNSNDIVIGTSVANRMRPELESIIGFFVNTLVLRTNTDFEQFDEYLTHVKEVNLSAQANQDVPFEHLVEQLQIQRSVLYTPLFQIMFSMNPPEADELAIPGLTALVLDMDDESLYRDELCKPQNNENRYFHKFPPFAQFDLNIGAVETEDGLVFSWNFDAQLFEPDSIKRLDRHLAQFLQSIADSPAAQLSEMAMLTETEQEHLRIGLNQTDHPVTGAQTVSQLFEQSVDSFRDNIAVWSPEYQITYEELNQKANQVAHYLIEQGVKPETMVGLYLDRNSHLITALLAVFKVGAAYVSIDPSYPEQRTEFMLQDSEIEFVMTQREYMAAASGEDIRIVLLDDDFHDRLYGKYATDNPNLDSSVIKPENLAYIIYTSGSTGQPKGAMVEQGNFVNLLTWYQQKYDINASDKVLVVSSTGFDLTQKNLFTPLLCGATLHFASANGYDVNLINQVIEQQKITFINCAPSAFYPIVEECERAEQLQRLSSLRLVLLGGEHVDMSRLSGWLTQSSGQLVNMYGPSECTDIASSFELSDVSEIESELPIGRPNANVALYVLEQNCRTISAQSLVPYGTIGELFIGGAGVGRGYLGRPEITAEKFIADPFRGVPGARMYRTGDLVRYQSDGNLLFVGRVDEQIKIRGFRIEPGEVESAISSCGLVNSSLVVAREDTSGQEQLVAYVIPSASADMDESRLTAAIRHNAQQKLPEYMVPTAWVFLESWPLTPNGKTDRNALPEPVYSRTTGEYLAPQNETEAKLVNIWSGLLKIPEDQLSVTANFFELGGHSLLAVRLMGEIRSELGIELPVRAVFEHTSVSDLADHLNSCSQTSLRPEILPRDNPEQPVTLSFAQQRLWFIDKFDGGSAEYNIPLALTVKGQFDTDAAQAAMQKIVERHEILRTNFAEQDDQPVQVIRAQVKFCLHCEDLSRLPESAQQTRVRQRLTEDSQGLFDLTSDLMVRASWLQLDSQPDKERGVLLFNTHHIASDGWSMGILVREFVSIYSELQSGNPADLPSLPIQYADYAKWQRDWLQGEVLEAQVEYWQSQLADLPAVHSLPLEYTRPAQKGHEAGQLVAYFDASLRDGLQALATAQGVTVFMVLHGALALLLSRHSNNDDIVIGTPVANRLQRELTPLMGFFVNTQVLRTSTAYEDFESYLSHVRQVNLDAQAHQDIPFEQLVDLLQVPRSVQHTPLFQIMFSMDTNEEASLNLPGLEFTPMTPGDVASKFDLDIGAQITEEGIQMNWHFDSALFSAKKIETFHRHYETLLRGIIAAPTGNLSELPMLSDAEQSYLLQTLNDTQYDYHSGQCLHQLFEAQVAKTPNAIALISGEEQLNYAALNDKANRLAWYLGEQGVTNNTLVGICMHRNFDLVAAILAILKAGGAWVPLDPSYPLGRLEYMAQDSRLKHVIIDSETEFYQALPKDIQAICLNQPDLHATLSRYSTENPVSPTDAGENDLAYVLYTSGSTGKPKGVMGSHKAILNRFYWMWRNYPIVPEDILCSKTILGFGDAIWEIFGGMLQGAKTLLVPLEEVKDSHRFLEHLANHKVTRLVVVPSLLEVLMAQKAAFTECLSNLTHISVSGERLPESLSREFLAFESRCQLLNLYGSCEIACDVTCYPVTDAHLQWNIIGRPIDNVQCYVLDKHKRIVPAGDIGELFIAGAALADGYLYSPEKTNERFIKNPFASDKEQRMFRTGDLVRYRENGLIEFIGRVDDQVKVRGFRIELGEVEYQIRNCVEVDSCVVSVQQLNSGNNLLVAYIKADADAPTEPPLVEVLRPQLQKHLPDFMMPSFFVAVENWPLNANGKIDKAALPEISDAMLQVDYVAPTTETETSLTLIWAELLGLQTEKISTTARFFELGGHSLLVVKLVAKINSEFSLDIQIREMFELQTIKEQALQIDFLTAVASRNHEGADDADDEIEW